MDPLASKTSTIRPSVVANENTRCVCRDKERAVSLICGCINPKCNWNRFRCSQCAFTARYPAWVKQHIKHNHCKEDNTNGN